MRWMLVLGCVVGCSDTFHDPVELLAARAAIDAIDCGHVGWGEDRTSADAHACAAAALAAGRPFRVLIDQAVADGRLAIGWIGAAGGGGEQLIYDAVIGQLCCDQEDVEWRACARIVDRGPSCDSLGDDLCFACE